MSRPRPEPVQVVKQRRDATLNALVQSIPYCQFLGVEFERRGDELTGVMAYRETNIGNPLLPALHGGATAAFLEITAVIGLRWATLWEDMENGTLSIDGLEQGKLPRLPKTIDFTIDYLRAGLFRDTYAECSVTRLGRRIANVHISAWQKNRQEPITIARAHFLLSDDAG